MWKVIWRAVRVSVATGAGAALAAMTTQPALLVVAPIVSAAGKAIREKDPGRFWWIPF